MGGRRFLVRGARATRHDEAAARVRGCPVRTDAARLAVCAASVGGARPQPKNRQAGLGQDA